MSQTEKKKPTHSMLDNSLWAVKMLVKYSPAAFAIIVLRVPVSIILQYLGVYLPSLVVEEVTTNQTPIHALAKTGLVLAAMLVCNLLQESMSRIEEAKFDTYQYSLADTITRKKLSMFYQDYEKKEVRDLAFRAEQSTQMWNGVIPDVDIIRYGSGIIKNILGYFLFGTVISFASPWLVPLLTVAPIINLLAMRAYNQWEYKNRAQRADINNKLRKVEALPDDFTTAKDIRIYSMAQWLTECFRDLSAEYMAWEKQDAIRKSVPRVIDLFIILIRDGAAYALLIAMILSGEITVSQFVLYFAAVSSFAGWISGTIDCWNRVHSSSLKLCDYRDYADYPDQDGTAALDASFDSSRPPEIVFDHVCYRYDEAAEDTIHDLSFTLRSGEKLAIVGLNGAGKTTVVKLLCGLYRPTSGEIRVNGRPVSGFQRKEYYKLFSPVFQDVRTAFFSLAETVSGTGTESTDLVRAEKCMRMAGLGEKLDALPQGIHTKLDKQLHKDGTELSGGEAQKLMLARALYKNAPVLVLDEPTAALDPIAESRVYETYNQMCSGKTSLFISHRLASTSFCDRIILLEKGGIGEMGTHQELLRLGGSYAKMYEIQSCWYTDHNPGGDEE